MQIGIDEFKELTKFSPLNWGLVYWIVKKDLIRLMSFVPRRKEHGRKIE